MVRRLLKLNISKCKTVSYCMKNMIDTEYFIYDGCIDHKIKQEDHQEMR